MKIRRGTTHDYKLVTERADYAFCAKNPVHVNFTQLRPDTIRADEESMSQWLLAEVDGEVAAGVHIVPRPIQLTENSCLQMSGLADVFTYPPYRGQGLMSALLTETIRTLDADGCPLNVLGGERLRYANYGWEIAGTGRLLELQSTTLRFDSGKVESSDLVRCKADDKALIQRMHDAHNQRMPRANRSYEEFERCLSRNGVYFWVCDTDAGFAYAAVKGNQIFEYAGDKKALEHIIRFLLGQGTYRVMIPPPALSSGLDEMLLEFAGHYEVSPAQMMRIINLQQTMTAYLPILTKRLRGWTGRRSILIEDNNDSVTVIKDGEDVRIAPGPTEGKDVDIALDRCAATRMVFGPFFPSCPSLDEDMFVRAVFPLPFYQSRLYKV